MGKPLRPAPMYEVPSPESLRLRRLEKFLRESQQRQAYVWRELASLEKDAPYTLYFDFFCEDFHENMHLRKLEVLKVTPKRVTARDGQTTYSLSRQALEQTGYVERGRHITIYAGWSIRGRIKRYLEGIEASGRSMLNGGRCQNLKV